MLEIRKVTKFRELADKDRQMTQKLIQDQLYINRAGDDSADSA